VVYRYGSNVPAADGAYGPNVTAPLSAWFLEYQRAGALDVIAGVLRHDPTLIEEGLRMFHYGLARQAPDGSFPGSRWPFHGTALFLSEAAPALLILKASAAEAKYQGEIAWEASRMRLAARNMVHWVGGPPHIDDSTKNHRWFEAAIALGATSVLAGDQTLRTWSTLYAWGGLRMGRRDGVMPEDGGHDSGYQAVGLTSATQYLALVATGALRSALQVALTRSEQWELSRIEADGSINQSGDTRTVDCRERDPTGQCKTVFYAPIFGALSRWAAISNDPAFARAAVLVWQRSGYGGPPSPPTP
jgi:hypothetical protein